MRKFIATNWNGMLQAVKFTITLQKIAQIYKYVGNIGGGKKKI